MGILSQQRKIVLAELDGFIEISLAERGASATFASGRQSNFEACSFEDFHRGNADVRLMIANESVVPKNDTTACGAMGWLVTPKPFVEAMTGIARQRSLQCNSEALGKERSRKK